MEPYDVDDRGNVVDFYCVVSEDKVARLDREAGDSANELAWDGGEDVTEWAMAHGYGDEITEATRCNR